MDPAHTVDFDPATHDPRHKQLLLSQLIVPRPIAMISTRDAEGVGNVGPFSYYLPITGEPMLVGVTMGIRADGSVKDTFGNLMACGDFVINVTTEIFAEQIETVAMDAPAEVDEFDLVGWTPVPATKVSSPAIGEALARLECEVRQVIELGSPGVAYGEVRLVIAEVVWVSYDESILNERGRIDPLKLGAIGRLGLRTFLRTVEEGAYHQPRIPWTEYVE